MTANADRVAVIPMDPARTEYAVMVDGAIVSTHRDRAVAVEHAARRRLALAGLRIGARVRLHTSNLPGMIRDYSAGKFLVSVPPMSLWLDPSALYPITPEAQIVAFDVDYAALLNAPDDEEDTEPCPRHRAEPDPADFASETDYYEALNDYRVTAAG